MTAWFQEAIACTSRLPTLLTAVIPRRQTPAKESSAGTNASDTYYCMKVSALTENAATRLYQTRLNVVIRQARQTRAKGLSAKITASARPNSTAESATKDSATTYLKSMQSHADTNRLQRNLQAEEAEAAAT